MLQGLSQPLTLCGSQRNFSKGWLSHAPLASLVPSAEAVPSAAKESIAAASCHPAQPSWGYLRLHLPRMSMERCGPEAGAGIQRVLGIGDLYVLRWQVGEKGKKSPLQPLFIPGPV